MIKVKRYLVIFIIAFVVLGVTTRAFCYAGFLKNFLDREFIDIYNYRYQLVTSHIGGALFSGLVKRINKGLKRLNVEDLSSLEKTFSEEGGRCAKFTEF